MISPDTVLRDAALMLNAGPDISGPGLALRLHQALQVAAAGCPTSYVGARDQLSASLGQPGAAWALAGHTATDMAAACVAATQPVLQLLTGGRPS